MQPPARFSNCLPPSEIIVHGLAEIKFLAHVLERSLGLLVAAKEQVVNVAEDHADQRAILGAAFRGPDPMRTGARRDSLKALPGAASHHSLGASAGPKTPFKTLAGQPSGIPIEGDVLGSVLVIQSCRAIYGSPFNKPPSHPRRSSSTHVAPCQAVMDSRKYWANREPVGGASRRSSPVKLARSRNPGTTNLAAGSGGRLLVTVRKPSAYPSAQTSDEGSGQANPVAPKSVGPSGSRGGTGSRGLVVRVGRPALVRSFRSAQTYETIESLCGRRRQPPHEVEFPKANPHLRLP